MPGRRFATIYWLATRLVAVLISLAVIPAANVTAAQANTLEPAPINEKLENLEAIEELTETAANRLIDFSVALRKRDYTGASQYLSKGFVGTALNLKHVLAVKKLHAGTEQVVIDCKKRLPVTPPAFVKSFEDVIARLTAVEHVFLKTRNSVFSKDGKTGNLVFTLQILGSQGRKRWNLYAHAHGAVQLQGGEWVLHRFVLDDLTLTKRATAMFTDVTESAGLAVPLPRLGKDGNSSFFWRGAAAVDLDGDGLDDVFASSPFRNYLYHNSGNGSFEDITKASGLDQSAEVTSPVFFDFDNDGDLDLLCAHAGWEKDNVPYGRPLELMRNDGKGKFEDVSFDLGVGMTSMFGYGASVADVNNDGWLDIFVCGYQHYGRIFPDSWYKATNGTPNALFLNQEGKWFENVAETAGVAGNAWSYASAFADFDGDGDQDIYIANDYGDNNLFRNNGDGTFVDVATELGVLDTGNGMGVLWADLNNDGKLDLYVSNMASSAGNRILRRFMQDDGSDVEQKLYKLASGNSIFLQGDKGFDRLPSDYGGVQASWSWGVSVLDVDLDGMQDLYVANGFISGDSLKDT